jgi:O-succinylbenzoic acid--CoA ligase
MSPRSEPARDVLPVTVPPTPDVVRSVLPHVAAALSGGPVLLPLPPGPAPLVAQLRDALRPDLALDVDDSDDPIALLVPTSGSEGAPKGVLLPASALRASATATQVWLGGPGRWLLALPATHIAGLQVLVRSVLAGTEPVAVDLSNGFTADGFAAAAARLPDAGPSRRYTALVPTQLTRLLAGGGPGLDALRAFDAVLVGGAAAAPGLVDEARACGVHVVETYGMTETCGGCVYDGVPLPGVRVAVSDGRIRVAGPVLARGYRLRPDLTIAAFDVEWFVTGDAGRLAPDGRLVVAGRVDEVAVTGGETVPLAAVDALVATHPGVLEAVAVALPDAVWGQRVVVAVTPVDAAVPPSTASVRRLALERATASHAPRDVVVVPELPRLASGKPDRAAVLALVRQHTSVDVP